VTFILVPLLSLPFGAESRPEFEENPTSGARHFGVLR
jgi:hypothetical protein